VVGSGDSARLNPLLRKGCPSFNGRTQLSGTIVSRHFQESSVGSVKVYFGATKSSCAPLTAIPQQRAEFHALYVLHRARTLKLVELPDDTGAHVVAPESRPATRDISEKTTTLPGRCHWASMWAQP